MQRERQARKDQNEKIFNVQNSRNTKERSSAEATKKVRRLSKGGTINTHKDQTGQT